MSYSQSNFAPNTAVHLYGDTSPGTISTKKFLMGEGLAREFRKRFPALLARFVQRHFSGYEEVGAFFESSTQTGLNIWNGANCASGDKVCFLALRHPQILDWIAQEFIEEIGRGPGGEGRD